MTPQEHYDEAVRLDIQADVAWRDSDCERAQYLQSKAQVHATLATCRLVTVRSTTMPPPGFLTR